MMKKIRKPVSILLVFMMIVSLFTVVPISAGATDYTEDFVYFEDLVAGDTLSPASGDYLGLMSRGYSLIIKGGTYRERLDPETQANDTEFQEDQIGDIVIERDEYGPLLIVRIDGGDKKAYYPLDAEGNPSDKWYVLSNENYIVTLAGHVPAEPATEAPTEAPTPANPQAGDVLPESDYLTFTAVEAGSSVKLNVSYGNNLQYNKNNSGWASCDPYTEIALENVGDSVSFSGEDVTYSSSYHVVIDGKVACSGSVMSLRLSDGVIQGLSEFCFDSMFADCAGLTTAPELPETALASFCYGNMFTGCTNLTAAPELPATTLADNCYYGMFAGCESLTTAPELPATTLANNCYYYMFYGCNSLTAAPELPATALARYCYSGMFQGCKSLTASPELPATTLAESCYYGMFYGCESLSELPELPATTLADSCYYFMFGGCPKIYISDEAGTFGDITYSAEYRIPSSGTAESAPYALNDMFNSTGGKFKGTPNLNTTYYIPAPAAELPEAIKDCTYKQADSEVYANVPFRPADAEDYSSLTEGAIEVDFAGTIKLADAKGYSYKFYDQTGTEIAATLSDSTDMPGSQAGLTDDVTVYVKQFTPALPENFEKLYIVATVPTTFTVTWKNGETVLETDENVKEGTMPEYNGTTPEKDEDGDYIYTFKGWSPEVSAVTGDVTYTAVFDSFKKYVVYIKTPKGSSYNLTVTNNTTIAQIKADLADELGIPAAQQRLIYAGKELEDTKTLVDYNIQKEDTIHDVPKSYTVTWLNDDSTTIDTTTVYYGDMPEYNGTTPVKDEDDDYTYTFAGWSPEVSAVTGDVEYTATFDATAKYEAGYYVVGTMNNWAIDPAYKLAANPATEGEYMLNDLALTATDEIKIVYAEPGKGKVWYPEGMGNNMTFPTDGSYNIYFRPDGQGGEDWYNGLIFAKRNPPAESAAVIDLINALPTDVTLTDAEQINAARNAYEALTDDQKSFIDTDTLKKLSDAETALAEAVDQDAADAVDDKIDSLPAEITLDDKADVEAARAAFDALTDDQKALIDDDSIAKLAAAEKAIADLEAAQAVTDQINALPDVVTLDDKADVEAARAAYNALSDDQKALIDNDSIAKLEAAETVIADREAAKAVTDQINALPAASEITLADKPLVDAAVEALDNLTFEQAEYITLDTHGKLGDAIKAIMNLEAAKTVTDQINALPTEITLNDKANVEAARAAFDALTDDQKALVTPETLEKLAAAEKAIADLEAVKAVEDMIKALPAVEDITLNDKDAVNATYDAFGALTDDQVFLLDGDLFDDLLDALQKIQDLEAAKVVEDKINALPDVILLEDKADVEDARAAYDALEPEQKDLIDLSVVEKLEDAEEVIADREAAKAVEDQINALPADITLNDKEAVDAANAARLNLTPAQADYLTFSAIDKLFKAQDKIRDLEAAKTVEDMINALPTDVTVDNKEQIDAARQAYDALTEDQKALVTPETLEKLTDAETTLDNIVLLGDVDGDGDVTSVDATMIQRYLLSMCNLSDKQIKAADIDGDGEATILDVTLIQRYLAEVPVRFPINEYI